ncbi:hydantoinase B/oxoprolinase family protein [Herbiconiux sp. YIM B11900]|uniref:hydantoinase B/oxoprolinase family protein n=1 Tax=Herbiconiux sp. YIM B11900 TaxID=3404131 RepID=UPI003F862B54
MTAVVPLGVMKSAFESLTREMAVDLRRAAFSSIVREARDFAVALTDARGEVVAQAECIPIMTAGISLALRTALETIDADSLTPDDAMLLNDPFAGGQHLQDIYLFTPIHVDGKLVAFAATTAHHVDIGGAHAGLSADATEVYQEGLRLPVSAFSVSRDWAEHGFVRRIIAANVRVPDMVIGDLEAQFAANATARTRFGEMVERYGAERTLESMSELQDYAERRFRAAIGTIPEGVYSAVDTMDGTPWGLGDLEIKATVTVTGSSIDVDFTGSAAQVAGNVNCPFASTISAVQSAVRCMLEDRSIPFNEGCNRPITVSAPLGSILNPNAPAAVRARLTPASRAFNVVVRALSTARPDNAVATGFDTTTAFAISHLSVDSGRYQVVMEILGGGWGACSDHDGADALDNPISNCANAPIESLETDYSHFVITEYSLNEATGGDGRQRGGLGIRRVYEALHDGVKIAGYADRHRTGAAGWDGGDSGGTGSFVVVRAGGEREVLDCAFSRILHTGDRIEIQTGGGGGYGPPADRSADARVLDTADGFLG